MCANLSNETYTRIVNYLSSHTNESYHDLTGYEDNVLYSKYKAAKYCMEKYPYLLDGYFQTHKNSEDYAPLEELLKMKVEKLESLVKKYHLTKAKKVKNAVVEGQITMDAIIAVQSQSTKETVTHIITSNQTAEEKDRDLQILTPKELHQMFGEDELSREELASRGYVSDEIKDPRLDKEGLRYDIIAEIYDAKLSINGVEIQPDDLINYGEEELTFLYNFVKQQLNKQEEQKRLKDL